MFGSSLRVLSDCGQRVIKFCGCCSVTGGYTRTLGGFGCVVRCDVCGAFTNGCGYQAHGMGGGCHGGNEFVMARVAGANMGRECFCSNNFGQGGPACGSRYSVVPQAVCATKQADLIRELGTHRYRLYKTASSLIVRRMEGLGGLRKGRD